MAPRLTPQEKAWRALTEAQHQEHVTDLATMYGWKWAHFSSSVKVVRGGRFVGDTASQGYPDLTLVHVRHGAAWVECKKEKGDYRPGQREWLDALCAAGLPAVCSRPSTLDEMRGWLMRGFPEPEECRHWR